MCHVLREWTLWTEWTNWTLWTRRREGPRRRCQVPSEGGPHSVHSPKSKVRKAKVERGNSSCGRAQGPAPTAAVINMSG